MPPQVENLTKPNNQDQVIFTRHYKCKDRKQQEAVMRTPRTSFGQIFTAAKTGV